MMIGLDTSGHFVYDPAVLDKLVDRMSDLCAQDPACAGRSDNLAQAMYQVNRNPPDHLLFFPIDSGTLRMLTHMMFFSNQNMAMVVDAYLAAAQGVPSGLAMLNFAGPFVFPFEMFHMDDFLSKGGTLDLEYYRGPESIQLGDSIMGAPLAEWVWPMAAQWPLNLVDADLRQLQESDVDMLVINGTLDFSTPPNALDEIVPYYHNAKIVLLPEFSHVGDVESLQPAAFERLVSGYYRSGLADSSSFVYQPLSFRPALSMVTLARIVLAAMVLIPPLLIAIAVILIRRGRRRRAGENRESVPGLE